jgi:cysteine desulfurase/selenocysteine lyase
MHFYLSHQKMTDFRSLFFGLDVKVPRLLGEMYPYINLDNAASTSVFMSVKQAVDRFLVFYSSVHRGTGFKSQLATHVYEQARLKVLDFVGADPNTHVCIYGKNTTEAVNKLARRITISSKKDVVLVSLMEHHSNDLPWRGVATVIHVGVKLDGSLDEADFDAKLAQYADRLAMVSITGASNVTGMINPIHRLAEKVHAVGAQIAVDCAQLAPHRKITMLSLDDPAHLDYVMLSAHKMYAPYGTGALIGRRDTFEQGAPDLRGGGQVEMVTEDDVYWSDPPDRDEAGSPNTVGAVALAAALDQLQAVGMVEVAHHEVALTEYVLNHLSGMPGITIYGDKDPHKAHQRLGVVPFNIQGMNHNLVAAILGYEFGIGVRNGCFCSHPYLLRLLNIHPDSTRLIRTAILNHDRLNVPGMVRISFGLYNTYLEIDALVSALNHIRQHEYFGVYHQDIATGEYHPEGWHVDWEQYYSFKV